MKGELTKSGVFVYENFRDHLIIDRFDPYFNTMNASKIEQMKSENSEDAITWNVFRSLQQIAPELWLPKLFQQSFGDSFTSCLRNMKIDLWRLVRPPEDMNKRSSEVDIMIETDSIVWATEAKYKSDVSKKTTHNEERNQIIRNIDVVLNEAKGKDVYFSLLALDENHSPLGYSLMEDYMRSPEKIVKELPHRDRGELSNISGLGILSWTDLKEVFSDVQENPFYEEERYFSRRAIEWLSGKGI